MIDFVVSAPSNIKFSGLHFVNCSFHFDDAQATTKLFGESHQPVTTAAEENTAYNNDRF